MPAPDLRTGPLVSVVMPFHNGGDKLRHALRSLLWQSYGSWELILVNDGSTDGSESVVDDFKDSRIRLVGDTAHRGLPVRLNQGVSLAKGEYIARMDADDVAFPERFSKQVAYLQQHPEVDLLAASSVMLDVNDNAIGLLAAGRSHGDICRHPWHGFPMPHPTWMGRVGWFRKNPYNEDASKAQDQTLLYSTYRTSTFAGLPDVLLGYRYARLSARKTLLGRYYYLRQLLASRAIHHLIFGGATHMFAACCDLAGMALRAESRIIRSKLHPVDDTLTKRWSALVRVLDNEATL